MQNKKIENIDILKELESELPKIDINLEDISENKDIATFTEEDNIIDIKNSTETDTEIINKELNTIKDNNILELDNIKVRKKYGLVSSIIFLFKYLITSAFIFGILLLGTNYNAYVAIAKSYVFQGDLENQKQNIINSVEASNIKEKYSEVKLEEIEIEKIETKKLSIKKMKQNQNKEKIDLNIEITPYENRLVIPRIGKNIPLIDIKNRQVEGESELNSIFMKELEGGVIRYPGSAKPGQLGTSFIFGHSSNFPWIKGDYNDVFALIDSITYGDKIIVYYGQKKYVYEIKEKKIVSPEYTDAIKRSNDKAEITLMTCWPIGTTLNRMLVTGVLIEES